MKIIQITNSLLGSNGNIALNISEQLSYRNICNSIYITHGKSNKSNVINFSHPLCNKLSALKSKLTGKFGFNNLYATKNLMKLLNSDKPDLIIFHNIHGHDFMIDQVFKYLNIINIPVVWVFHDCWAFTGGCANTQTCTHWKTNCHNCPQIRKFSFFLDSSTHNFKLKEVIANYNNIKTVITPSNWLNTLVKESIFKEKNIITNPNGIDTSIFKLYSEKSKFLNNIDKKVLVACATILTENKGLSKYIELSKIIRDDYQIVLIGQLNDSVNLPKNITHIDSIYDKKELALIYNNSFAYINLTQMDNLPTVNIEAQACGCPVICNNIGGCKDTLAPNYSQLIDFNNLSHCLGAIEHLKTSTIDRQYLHNYIDQNFNKQTQNNKLIDICLKSIQKV